MHSHRAVTCRCPCCRCPCCRHTEHPVSRILWPRPSRRRSVPVLEKRSTGSVLLFHLPAQVPVPNQPRPLSPDQPSHSSKTLTAPRFLSADTGVPATLQETSTTSCFPQDGFSWHSTRFLSQGCHGGNASLSPGPASSSSLRRKDEWVWGLGSFLFLPGT